MATTYMGGKVDVSLNGVTIPAQFISDDGVKTTLAEGTREVKTMAGTFRQASGTYDESNVVFTIVLPSMNYVKNIFPELYVASTDRPSVAGQIDFGGDTCSVRENTSVVVHYSCADNSDDDVYIPNGSVEASVELTQNSGDPVTVEVTVDAQPDEDTGLIARLGTGSLTGPTLWNPATEEYEPVSS